MSIIHIQLYITTVQLAYMSASFTINSVQIKDSAVPTKGSNIQLVCSISGFTSDTEVSWYKRDAQTIPDGTRYVVKCNLNTCIDGLPGYTYATDASNIYVTITSLNQSTDGKWWICQSATQSQALQLVVYTLPQSLIYAREPSETQDLSNNSVTMECKTSCAYPAPTFVWYYLETGGTRQQYATPGVAGDETDSTCTNTEKLYTSTLTLPRYTTFAGNADKTVKLVCGIPIFHGQNTALYTPLSPDITFAVKTTSVTLRDGSSQPTSSSVVTVTSYLSKTLTCSPSLSRPAATIVWYIGNVEKQKTSTSFTFTPSDNDHDKQVYCKAFNTLPESQAVFSEIPKLYVQVAPEVTADLSTSSLEENSSVNITCNAAGRPATYTYTDLVQTWRNTVIQNTHSNLVGTEQHSSLALTSLQFQDTGNYTCHVNNGIKDRKGELDQTGNVFLKVKVSPKIFPVRVIFAGAPEDTVNMSIPFYSYPATVGVMFTKQGGSPIKNGDRHTVSNLQAPVLTQFYGQDVTLEGNIAVLEIKNLQEEDFVNYTLTIRNNIGTEVQIFSLILNSLPFPPKTFVYLGLFDGVPRFYWENGFNGGHVQFFVIETTLIGTDNWIKHGVVAEGDQLYQQKNKSYIANITELAPGKYSARLTAENKLGPIEVSDRPTVTFTILESGPSSSVDNVATIGSGIGAAVLVIIIVVLILVVWKRRRAIKDERTTALELNESNIIKGADKDSNDEVTENLMYGDVTSMPTNHKTGLSTGTNSIVNKPKQLLLTENSKDKKDKDTYDENTYENPEDCAIPNQPTTNVNKDGLVYTDLFFKSDSKGQGKLVTHDLDNLTEYVQVDFTRKAEPLPDSDEDNKTTDAKK